MRNPLPLLPVQKYIPLNSGSPHPETLTRRDNPNIGIGTYGPALPSRGPTPSICSCALNIFIAHFNNRPSANRCVRCSADLLDNSRNLWHVVPVLTSEEQSINSNIRNNTSSTAKCCKNEYLLRRNADEGDSGCDICERIVVGDGG